MSAALDIVTMLQAESRGTVGTDLFANVMPDKPKSCAAAFDIPSAPVVTAHGMSPVNQRRYVQIQRRDPDPQLAAEAVQSDLDAIATTMTTALAAGTKPSANSRNYEMLRIMGSAQLLGRDDNNNTIFYGEVEATIDLG